MSYSDQISTGPMTSKSDRGQCFIVCKHTNLCLPSKHFLRDLLMSCVCCVLFHVRLNFHDRTPRLGPVPEPCTVECPLSCIMFTLQFTHLHFKIVNVTIKLSPLHLSRSGYTQKGKSSVKVVNVLMIITIFCSYNTS